MLRFRWVALFLIGSFFGLSIAPIAHSEPTTIQVGQKLVATFQLDPNLFQSEPNYLHLGFNTNFVGRFTATLFDGTEALGTYDWDGGGAITARFVSRSNDVATNATVVDNWSSIADGSIDGRIEITPLTGPAVFDPEASITSVPGAPSISLSACSAGSCPPAAPRIFPHLSITEVERATPIHYGLFIGANHRNDDAAFRFDRNAQDMGAAFDARPNTIAEVLTGDIESDPITIDEIEEALDRLRTIMRFGDTLTLYINNHGDSINFSAGERHFNGEGLGDEAIQVGEREYLWDNTLAYMLQDFDGHRITVFLDTCHGGGFWGGHDGYELSPGLGYDDLNSLNNIALYAAAPERSEGYGVGRWTFWGAALLEAFEAPVSWTPEGLADHLGEHTILGASLAFLQNPVWYTADYGDPVTPDMSLIETFSAHSADYDLESTLFEGPDVSTQFSDLLELVEGTYLADTVSAAQDFLESNDTYAACSTLSGLMIAGGDQAGDETPSTGALAIQAHSKFIMSALGCTEQLADSDTDGVPDAIDACPASNGSLVNTEGCTVQDLCPCDAEWKNRFEYLRCNVRESRAFYLDSVVSRKQRFGIIWQAFTSRCGVH